uniref:Hairy/enhancer-of-split related with YRPW motif protein 1 n=1 Tax=Schistocephalus solidus TaxID=70667 RepID=A0A0V0J7Q5_SCHSO
MTYVKVKQSIDEVVMRGESSPVMKRNVTSVDEDPDDFLDDEDLGPSCTGYGTDRKRRRGIIEKRRRDRINFNLSELRRLVPDAAQKQPSSKLEKAEILQMTVEFLHRIHRDGNVLNAETRLLENRLLGFQECFAEVTRFLAAVPVIGEVDELLRRKLLGHLHACIYRRDFEARSRLASLSAMASAGDPRTRCREPRQPAPTSNHAPTPAHAAEFTYAHTHPVNAYVECGTGPNTFTYPTPQERAEPCLATTNTTPWGDSQKLAKSAAVLPNEPQKPTYDQVPRLTQRGLQNQSFVRQQQFLTSTWSSHATSAQLSCSSTLQQNESQSTTSPSLQGNFEELESGSTSVSSTGNRCSPDEPPDELHLTPGNFAPNVLRDTSSQQLTHQSHSSSSSAHTQYNYGQTHDAGLAYNCCPSAVRDPMTGGFSCTDGSQFEYASSADPSYTEIRTEGGPPQEQCSGYSSVELQPVAPDFLRQAVTASQVYRQDTGKSDNFAYF